MTAPAGAVFLFVATKAKPRASWRGALLFQIWRPAVSGTGGIQDDRIAERQKPSDWQTMTPRKAPDLATDHRVVRVNPE